MKTSQATINLVLNTQRKNKQGQCPVVLRVAWQSSRVTLKSGIYIAENQWDKKSQLVKSGVEHCGTYNAKLLEIKQMAITRLNQLVASGRPYTAADVISDRKIVDKDCSIADLLEDMIRYKGLSHNSSQAYRACVRRLGEAGVFRLGDVSPDLVQGICKRMKRAGLGDSTVNVTIACLGSLWRYGADRGMCEGYLFSRFKAWKKYRIAERRVCLTKEEIRLMIDDFVSRSVVADGMKGEWMYTDEAYLALMNRNSELFAQVCFLLSYQLQGLAFADLVRIKSDNISLVESGGKEYYVVSGIKRKKTNKLIKPMYIERDLDTCVLFDCFFRTMDLRDGYFLPVLQNNNRDYRYGDDAKKISEATGSCSVIVNKGLKNVFSRLGISEDATFYSARHTFASIYMTNDEASRNPVYLADMMGRSVQGIFRYVRGLSSMEQSIRERKGMI